MSLFDLLMGKKKEKKLRETSGFFHEEKSLYLGVLGVPKVLSEVVN